MARLDLIKFDTGEYGLQEVGDDGELLALFDHEGDQLPFQRRSWDFVRTLAAGPNYDFEESDDFWRAIEDVAEITPRTD